ncbi:MAG: baseplate J/gp47 family protein [Myxococcales bacterium]|nr:baseplate J/gp47 family protein [Myxococcales bacterium]
MALSIEQLTTATTVDAALELILDELESEGFPARSWQEGSVNRTEVEFLAQLMASNSTLINEITKGAYNELAEGLALTLFSASHYENDRDTGTRAQWNIRLVTTVGSGPYSPGVGDVIVQDPVLGVRFRNLNALVLTDGGATEDVFEAELIGVDGSAPGTNDINVLVTALAGVTVTNPDASPLVNGADVEGDPELQTRNTNKWATLSMSGPSGIYIVWSLAADQAVTRANVDDTNAAGAGAVVVYIADADAGLAGPTDAVVLAYILERRPLGATVTVLPAASLPVVVTYVASHDSTIFATAAEAEAAIEAALDTYRQTFPIGGTGPTGAKVFPLGGVYAAANAVTGIVNVTFTSPTIDTPMTVGQVAVFTATGTSTPV